eukprot:1740463-Rhodomonas_salina.3
MSRIRNEHDLAESSRTARKSRDSKEHSALSDQDGVQKNQQERQMKKKTRQQINKQRNLPFLSASWCGRFRALALARGDDRPPLLDSAGLNLDPARVHRKATRMVSARRSRSAFPRTRVLGHGASWRSTLVGTKGLMPSIGLRKYVQDGTQETADSSSGQSLCFLGLGFQNWLGNRDPGLHVVGLIAGSAKTMTYLRHPTYTHRLYSK